MGLECRISQCSMKYSNENGLPQTTGCGGVEYIVQDTSESMPSSLKLI